FGGVEVAGEHGVAGARGGGAEQVVGGGAKGGQPTHGNRFVRGIGKHGRRGGRSRHQAAAATGECHIGKGGSNGRSIPAAEEQADIKGGRQIGVVGADNGCPTGAIWRSIAGNLIAPALDFEPVRQAGRMRI